MKKLAVLLLTALLALLLTTAVAEETLSPIVKGLHVGVINRYYETIPLELKDSGLTAMSQTVDDLGEAPTDIPQVSHTVRYDEETGILSVTIAGGGECFPEQGMQVLVYDEANTYELLYSEDDRCYQLNLVEQGVAYEDLQYLHVNGTRYSYQVQGVDVWQTSAHSSYYAWFDTGSVQGNHFRMEAENGDWYISWNENGIQSWYFWGLVDDGNQRGTIQLSFDRNGTLSGYSFYCESPQMMMSGGQGPIYINKLIGDVDGVQRACNWSSTQQTWSYWDAELNTSVICDPPAGVDLTTIREPFGEPLFSANGDYLGGETGDNGNGGDSSGDTGSGDDSGTTSDPNGVELTFAEDTYLTELPTQATFGTVPKFDLPTHTISYDEKTSVFTFTLSDYTHFPMGENRAALHAQKDNANRTYYMACDEAAGCYTLNLAENGLTYDQLTSLFVYGRYHQFGTWWSVRPHYWFYFSLNGGEAYDLCMPMENGTWVYRGTDAGVPYYSYICRANDGTQSVMARFDFWSNGTLRKYYLYPQENVSLECDADGVQKIECTEVRWAQETGWETYVNGSGYVSCAAPEGLDLLSLRPLFGKTPFDDRVIVPATVEGAIGGSTITAVPRRATDIASKPELPQITHIVQYDAKTGILTASMNDIEHFPLASYNLLVYDGKGTAHSMLCSQSGGYYHLDLGALGLTDADLTKIQAIGTTWNFLDISIMSSPARRTTPTI